jgi:hypothetical protein
MGRRSDSSSEVKSRKKNKEKSKKSRIYAFDIFSSLIFFCLLVCLRDEKKRLESRILKKDKILIACFDRVCQFNINFRDEFNFFLSSDDFGR